MHSRKKLLRGAKLYLILDAQVCSYDKLFEIVKISIKSGIDILQLRDKNGSAKDILKFSHKVLKFTKNRIPFIVNDRIDIALSSGAAGVHLGQEDLSVKDARQMLGKDVLVGVSCQSYVHAKRAVKEGADYIGFGSVFKTLTKPDRQPMDLALLKKIYKNIKIPVFAIGGINLKNLNLIQSQGVDRVAVTRVVLNARSPLETIKNFKTKLMTDVF